MKVRESLPFILVPVFIIIFVLSVPDIPLIMRLFMISFTSVFLFLAGKPLIRSLLRKPRPNLPVEYHSKQYDMERVSEGDVFYVKDSSGILLGSIKREIGDSGEKAEGFLHRAVNAFSLVVVPPEISREQAYSRFVFEATDGRRQGEMRRRLIGWKYTVFDVQNKILAIIRPSEQVSAPSLADMLFRIDDSEGRLLAEYDGDAVGTDYRIVSPAGNVITRVCWGLDLDEDSCHIDVFDKDFDPFLIYCYVVALNNTIEWIGLMGKYRNEE